MWVLVFDVLLTALRYIEKIPFHIRQLKEGAILYCHIKVIMCISIFM